MKKTLVIVALAFAACGGGNNENNNSNTDTTASAASATLNDLQDTTSVIGDNKIGQGHMRTDTAVQGANVGK